MMLANAMQTKSMYEYRSILQSYRSSIERSTSSVWQWRVPLTSLKLISSPSLMHILTSSMLPDRTAFSSRLACKLKVDKDSIVMNRKWRWGFNGHWVINQYHYARISWSSWEWWFYWNLWLNKSECCLFVFLQDMNCKRFGKDRWWSPTFALKNRYCTWNPTKHSPTANSWMLVDLLANSVQTFNIPQNFKFPLNENFLNFSKFQFLSSHPHKKNLILDFIFKCALYVVRTVRYQQIIDAQYSTDQLNDWLTDRLTVQLC